MFSLGGAIALLAPGIDATVTHNSKNEKGDITFAAYCHDDFFLF